MRRVIFLLLPSWRSWTWRVRSRRSTPGRICRSVSARPSPGCAPTRGSVSPTWSPCRSRRDGSHRQQSVYLDYRTHLHPGVHRVQDWLIANPAERASLAELGRLAALSPRHLTRVFRQATGVSVQEFTTRLRLELARGLLHDPRLTVEGVATRCGFASARQLRRLWKEVHGTSPGSERGRVQ